MVDFDNVGPGKKPPSQGPTKPVTPGFSYWVPAPQPSSDPEEAGVPYYDPSTEPRKPVDRVDRVDRVDDAARVATFQTRLQGADTGSEDARAGVDKDAAKQPDADSDDSDDSDDSKELRERYRAASNIQDRYDRTAALAAIWKALVAKKTGSVVATRDVNTKDFFTPEERVQMERNGFKDTPAFRKSILDSGHEVAASRAAHYIQAEIREENAQKRGNLGVVGKQQRIKSALLKGDTETVRKAFDAENAAGSAAADTTPAAGTVYRFRGTGRSSKAGSAAAKWNPSAELREQHKEAITSGTDEDRPLLRTLGMLRKPNGRRAPPPRRKLVQPRRQLAPPRRTTKLSQARCKTAGRPRRN